MYNKVEICGVNTANLKVLTENEKMQLLKRMHAGDRKAREELVNGNLRLVLSVIQRFTQRGENLDDLFQVGCIGLIKSIDNFDISQNVRFSTYAVPMIAGEIKRFLRDDGSVKVSRIMKKAARDMNLYIEACVSERGEQPSVKELAQKFGMDEGEVVFTLGSARMPVSIYEQGDYKDEKGTTLAERLPAAEDQEDVIERIILKEAMEKLSEREQKIVFLRYFRDLTQSEVARRIGVSQVQISRIEKKALAALRQHI